MEKLIFIFLILISIVSCDLFSTRDSEKPNESKSNFQPPVEKEIVIENLKNSLIDKNAENYIACFVDTLLAQKRFSFSASSEATINYQIFLQGWGINEEQRYIKSVFNKVPKEFPISLTLSDESYTNLGGDSLIYSATYFLSIPALFGDSGTSNYSGILQFNMLRNSRALWAIYYWKDTKSQSLPSWSELKGSFY